MTWATAFFYSFLVFTVVATTSFWALIVLAGIGRADEHAERAAERARADKSKPTEAWCGAIYEDVPRNAVQSPMKAAAKAPEEPPA